MAFFQAKLDVSHNLEQHAAFQVGMHPFEQYMIQVFNGEEKYDGKKNSKLLLIRLWSTCTKRWVRTLVFFTVNFGEVNTCPQIPTISEERSKLRDKEERRFLEDIERCAILIVFLLYPSGFPFVRPSDLEEHLQGKFTAVPFIMTHHHFEETPSWVYEFISSHECVDPANSDAN